MRNWQVLASSITGSSHSAMGSGCQDAVRTTFKEVREASNRPQSVAPPLFCAVADGVGSRPQSGVAANLAVELLVGSFLAEAHTPEGGRQRDLSTAEVDAVIKRSMARGISRYREMMSALVDASRGEHFDGATTLGGMWVGANFIGVAAVGDVFVVAHRTDGECVVLLAPEEMGEFANQTSFLSHDSKSAAYDSFVVCDTEIDAVAICTDGLTEVGLAGGDHGDVLPVAEFFGPLFRELIADKFDGPRLNRLMARASGTVGDDLSIAVAWRDQHEF